MVMNITDLVEEVKKAKRDIEIVAILAIAWDRGVSFEQRRICEIVRHNASNPTTLLQKIRRPSR